MSTWEQETYLNDSDMSDSEALRTRLNRLEQGLANLNSAVGLGPLVQAEQSATLTLNRAGGFAASQVFDLAKDIASVLVVATLTARTADGETFGTSAGNIGAPAPTGTTSPDSTHYSSDIASWSVFTVGANLLTAVSDSVSAAGTSGRYLKVAMTLAIVGGANPYDGANNPTATVDLTVSYV